MTSGTTCSAERPVLYFLHWRAGRVVLGPPPRLADDERERERDACLLADLDFGLQVPQPALREVERPRDVDLERDLDLGLEAGAGERDLHRQSSDGRQW